MCPVCLSGAAWLITEGVSVLGATAGGAAIVRDRKIASKISKIWKPNRKRDTKWPQTMRETTNLRKEISQ